MGEHEGEKKKKAMPFVTEVCDRGRLCKAHTSLWVVPAYIIYPCNQYSWGANVIGALHENALCWGGQCTMGWWFGAQSQVSTLQVESENWRLHWAVLVPGGGSEVSSLSNWQTCLGFQGCPMHFWQKSSLGCNINIKFSNLLFRRRGNTSLEFNDNQWNSAWGALNFKADELPSS